MVSGAPVPSSDPTLPVGRVFTMRDGVRVVRPVGVTVGVVGVVGVVGFDGDGVVGIEGISPT